MPVQFGSFEGKPTICLNPESQYQFKFGLAKARLIVANYEAIKAWVDANPAAAKPAKPQPVGSVGAKPATPSTVTLKAA